MDNYDNSLINNLEVQRIQKLNSDYYFCFLQGVPGSPGLPGEAGRDGGDVCVAHF